jgi:catechol 2,3-dioxygenase
MSHSLQLDSIHLRVPDVAASTHFYTEKMGFVVRQATADEADLAVSAEAPALLKLSATSEPPAARDCAGLFHAALLLPGRPALANWLDRAVQHGLQFDGFSDHGVSEAIYCTDNFGNGLEIYVDRPRAAWPCQGGELAMGTEPLDLDGLLSARNAGAPGPVLGGSRWGHLHLRVTKLPESETFYRTTLGMDVTQRSYPGARFLAADGYHHHVGLNIWTRSRRPQPPGAPGLAEATFSLASRTSEEVVSDPDGIHLRLRALVGRR